MGGWKTWAAAIGSILTGLGMIALSITGQGEGSVQDGIAFVIAGLGMVGLGHKLEKNSGG